MKELPEEVAFFIATVAIEPPELETSVAILGRICPWYDGGA